MRPASSIRPGRAARSGIVAGPICLYRIASANHVEKAMLCLNQGHRTQPRHRFGRYNRRQPCKETRYRPSGCRSRGETPLGTHNCRPLSSLSSTAMWAPISRRSYARIDNDVENRSTDHPHQLCLGCWRTLEVKTAQRALLLGSGMVVLYEDSPRRDLFK